MSNTHPETGATLGDTIRSLLDNPPDVIARVWQLEADPALTELSGIAADVDALAERIGDFIEDHRHDADGCHCCTEVNARSPGPPDLWSALEALHFTLWSAHNILDDERPKTAADLPGLVRMLERIARDDDAKAAAKAAEDTVAPDAVAEG